MATTGGTDLLQRDILGQGKTIKELGQPLTQQNDIVAVGTNSSASNKSVCLGYGANNNGRPSNAIIGPDNTVESVFAVVAGGNNSVRGDFAVACGTQLTVGPGGAVSVTIGLQLTTGGNRVVNIGVQNTLVSTSNSVFVVGELIVPGANATQSVFFGRDISSDVAGGISTSYFIGNKITLEGSNKSKLVVFGDSISNKNTSRAVLIGDTVSNDVAAFSTQIVMIGQTLSNEDSVNLVNVGTSNSVTSSNSTSVVGQSNTISNTTTHSVVSVFGNTNSTSSCNYVHCFGDNNTIGNLTQSLIGGSNNTVNVTATAGVSLLGIANSVVGNNRENIIIHGNYNELKGDSVKVIIVGTSNNIEVVNESTTVVGHGNYIAPTGPTSAIEPIIVGNRNSHQGSFCVIVGNGNSNNFASGSIIMIGTVNVTTVNSDAAIAIGFGCGANGVASIAMGYYAVAASNECVIGNYDPIALIDGSYHTFVVRGHNTTFNVAVDTLKAIDNPAVGLTGLFVPYNTGATVTSKQVKTAFAPPVGSLILYLDP